MATKVVNSGHQVGSYNINESSSTIKSTTCNEKTQRVYLQVFNVINSVDNERLGQNMINILGATILSTIGGTVGGVPNIRPTLSAERWVISGGILQAISNGGSTYFVYNTGIVAKMEKDLADIAHTIQAKKEERNLKADSEENLDNEIGSNDTTELEEGDATFDSDASTEIEDSEVYQETRMEFDIEAQEEVTCFYAVRKTAQKSATCMILNSLDAINMRNIINIARVNTSAWLTFGGAIIGGLPSITASMGIVPAVLVGALLGALGNAASTYLAWDSGKIAELRKRVGDLNKEIDNLMSLVYDEERAEWISQEESESNKDVTLSDWDLIKEKLAALFQGGRVYINKRNGINIINVVFAGGLSGVGSVIAGLPAIINALGVFAIVLGSAIAGIANGFSTYLAWKTHEEEALIHEISTLKQKLEAINRMQNT